MLEGNVDTSGDVHALLVKGHEHRAVLSVEALGAVVVANVEDRLSRDGGYVDGRAGRDLTGDDAQAVVSNVSHATRAVGSWVRIASSTPSEI